METVEQVETVEIKETITWSWAENSMKLVCSNSSLILNANAYYITISLTALNPNAKTPRGCGGVYQGIKKACLQAFFIFF